MYGSLEREREPSGLKLKAISTLATRTVRRHRAASVAAMSIRQSQSLPGGSVCMVTFSCLYTGLATRALGGIHKTYAQAQAQAPTQAQTWRHTQAHTLPNDRALLLTVVWYRYCPPASASRGHSLAGNSKVGASSLRCITRTILPASTYLVTFVPVFALALSHLQCCSVCF